MAGRVALLHALAHIDLAHIDLAHIELNAVDLSWDIVTRFADQGLPRRFSAVSSMRSTRARL